MQKISTNYIKHVIIVDIFANVKCILSAEPPWKFQVGTNGLEAEVRAQVSVISKAGEKNYQVEKTYSKWVSNSHKQIKVDTYNN